MIRQGVSKQDRTAVKNALQLAYQLQTPIEACQETAESQGSLQLRGPSHPVFVVTFWIVEALLLRLPRRHEVSAVYDL